MRKWIAVLLCIVMLGLCGCTPTPQVETTETTVPVPQVGPNTLLPNDGKSLKLLAITSSFGVDTTDYLYDIAMAEGVEEVIVGRLFFGACTLKRHVNNAISNNPEYEFTKKANGEWLNLGNASIKQGLLSEDWDIIFIQQSAAESGQTDTYKDYVDQLVDYINENKTNSLAEIIWNMTWAYQADSEQQVFLETFNADQMYMYQSIVGAMQEHIVPRTDLAALIPSGTAIQNARTSYFGDMLTRDTLHLNDLGKVIAGYTLYSVLADKPLTEMSLTKVSEGFSLSDSNKEVIMEAVNNAIEKPFEVTPSSYTD